MKKNGFAEVVVLYFIIGALALLFVPNPISSSLGVGIRPNKTVYKEKVDLIQDGKGNVIATKTSTSDEDIQQHVTFWEWLRSLPFLVLFLMGAGIVFPGVSLFLHRLYSGLKADAKKIVLSVDKGLAVIKAKDPLLHQATLDAMSKIQGENSSTEALVTDLQQKQ